MADFETMIGIRDRVRGAHGALGTMGLGDLAVSQGQAFTVTNTVQVSPAATGRWTIAPPATGKKVHLISARFWFPAACTLSMYSAPTITVAGTPITPTNRDLSSATASASTVTHTPTVTVPGTLLATMRNTISSVPAPLDVSGYRWILAPGRTYYFLMDGVGSGPSAGYLNLEWLEL